MTPLALRRRWLPVVALLAAVVVAGLAVALGTGSGTSISATGVASVMPSDALAYVSLSLDRGSPAVRQGLTVGSRLPNFGLAGTEVLGRLGEVLAGGRAIDFSSQVLPWAGDAAALALLNTTTSTAGSLVVVEVAHPAQARAFIRGEGAAADGTYRGVALRAYPNGNVLAFVGSDLVVGQPDSVRTAIDVAAGSTPSLTGSTGYQRAKAGSPTDSVLGAYASAAGVRRVLAGQSGVLGALGGLLSEPTLKAVFVSAVPTSQGVRVQIHSALDPSSAAPGGFDPTLAAVIPASAGFLLDLDGLNRIAPAVLDAGSTAGVTGGVGPLLSELGRALTAVGVNVKEIVSLFSGETAVAIVGTGRSAALMIVARTSNPARAEAAFAQIQSRLGRLVATSGHASARSLLSVHRVAGITVHGFQLTPTLQLDYAVFRGLVVVATNPSGIAALADRRSALSGSSAFRLALGTHSGQVTSLGFAELGQVLSLDELAHTGSATLERLAPDLERIGAVGLTATRAAGSATTVLTVQIK